MGDNERDIGRNERDIGRIEGRIAALEGWVEDVEGRTRQDFKRLEDKVDRLLEAMNMGRGAWWAMLKLGGIITLVIGAAIWVYEHWVLLTQGA